MLHTFIVGAFEFDFSKFYPRPAARCVLAMALVLLVGLVSHHVLEGVGAAAGAFSAGFGSFHEFRKSRVAPMLYASVGVCVASFIGTLAGHSTPATVFAATMAGVAYATLSALSPSVGYIGLQCAVWTILSTAHPGTPQQALVRGSAMLFGGLLQTLVVTSLWGLERTVTPAAGGSDVDDAKILRTIRDALSTRKQIWFYVLRAGLTLAVSAELWRRLNLANGYWIPMTAVIVMKPDLVAALQLGIARIAGTLVGAALLTVVVVVLKPNAWVLAAMVLLSAWLAYSLIYVNYAAYAVVLTAYVVLLLAFVGEPSLGAIIHRTCDTVIGGLVALFLTIAFKRLEEQPAS